MSKEPSQISRCATCGYGWKTGTDGSHNCSTYLSEKVQQLEKSWQLENQIIELLVVGGFTTREKVEQAREFLSKL